MSNSPKITYFLGAGASYYSVPVINELQKQLGELPKQISSQNHYSSKFKIEIDEFDNYLNGGIEEIPSNNLFSYILYELSQLSKRSLKYSTIDTFALYCKHQNPQYYKIVKHLLNIYFTMWQARKNIDIKDDSSMVWEEIDPRYIGLISAIFRKEEKVMISENINFII